MKKIRFILIVIFIPVLVRAQDLRYARNVIDTLCSPAFHGRGYAFRGDSMAADFIAHEFNRSGLHHFGKFFFQPFNIPVNVFPGMISVKIGHHRLVAGKDFIISPESPSINGSFRVTELGKTDLSSNSRLNEFLLKSSGKVILINKTEFKMNRDSVLKIIDRIIQILKNDTDYNPAAIVVAGKSKLIWSTGITVDKRPVIFTNYIPDRRVRKIAIHIDQEFIRSYRTKNVIGYIRTGQDMDSAIVITAHYDHLGMMGKSTRFPGANDNASGTALMLDLARELVMHPDSLRYPVIFIGFSGEEAGLLGSRYYVKNPIFDLSRIKFLINLDLAGTGDEGITVVNATQFKKEFTILNRINDRYDLLPAVNSRGEACNSDHCFFYRAGVPCFFIYTLGGIQAYHDIYDRPETLPLTAYDNYFTLLKDFILQIDTKLR